MKADNRTKIPIEFGPETRFEARLVSTAPCQATRETGLERLKESLLQKILAETPQVELNAPLRLAANEAAGLAWLTPFPLLFLPTLLEEKVAAVRCQAHHQAQVNQRCRSSEGMAA